jgi:hypothetical protein
VVVDGAPAVEPDEHAATAVVAAIDMTTTATVRAARLPALTDPVSVNGAGTSS